MNTVLKVTAAVCMVGIVAVFVYGTVFDGTNDASAATVGTGDAIDVVTPAPPGAASAGTAEGTADDSTTLQIAELSAECPVEGDYGVSPLPLGADWRQTVRAVYSRSPVAMTCNVEGGSGDLTYDWYADDGDITGTGPQVVWTAPPHGAHLVVSVLVRDALGNADTAEMTFRVVTCSCLFTRY